MNYKDFLLFLKICVHFHKILLIILEKGIGPKKMQIGGTKHERLQRSNEKF